MTHPVPNKHRQSILGLILKNVLLGMVVGLVTAMGACSILAVLMGKP
jgi:hypothetical protein